MTKISISGTHSVGKTTLAEALHAQFASRLNTRLVPEAARVLASRGFRMNHGITEYGAINYLLTYLKNDRANEIDLLISDRSSLDLLAYILVNNSPKIRGGVVDLIREVVRLEVAHTSAYLYIPVEFPLQIDSLRPESLKYQSDVDRQIKTLLTEYDARWHSITGPLEDRIDQSRAIIEQLHK